MSSPEFGNVPGLFKAAILASFIAADGTAAKLLVDNSTPSAMSATAPKIYGGYSMIDLTVASSDSSTKDFALWKGTVLTTVGANTGTVATTASGNGTITRSSNSWVADGWNVGDLLMFFAPTAPGSGITKAAATLDGIMCTVTAVVAGTVTFNGTPIAAAAITAGYRICKMSLCFKFTVPANAGNSVSIGNYSVLNNSNDSSLLRTELKIGVNDVLAVQPLTAVSALPAFVSFNPTVAGY